MPILVDKTTPTPENKQTPLKNAGEPWIDNIDYDTGEVTYNNAEMNKLKSAITSSINKNDAILLANQGDIRAAYRAGYIRITVDSDGMPNWGDLRKVVMLQTASAELRDNVTRCPGAVLRQAMLELDQQDKFRRVEPKVVY